MINLKNVVVTAFATNCYFLIKDDKCIIFDCGDGPDIISFLEENKLTPVKLFLTHGHSDHIGGVSSLKSKYTNLEIIACDKEKELLEDPNKNMSATFNSEPISLKCVTYKKDYDIIDALDYKIKLIHTPGHTIGSCCYYIESEKILFSGDTLFKEAYGRYDLPTGSIKDLIISIGVNLMKLPDDTKVFPGHGKETTIAYERKNNEITTESAINWAK